MSRFNLLYVDIKVRCEDNITDEDAQAIVDDITDMSNELARAIHNKYPKLEVVNNT